MKRQIAQTRMGLRKWDRDHFGLHVRTHLKELMDPYINEAQKGRTHLGKFTAGSDDRARGTSATKK